MPQGDTGGAAGFRELRGIGRGQETENERGKAEVAGDAKAPTVGGWGAAADEKSAPEAGP